jgi:hypothetical protein
MPHSHAIRIDGRFLAFILAGLACACAPHPARRPVALPPIVRAGGSVECHMERITGSLVATRVCTTKTQRDLMRRRVQTMHDVLTRSPSTLCPAGADCIGK